MIRRNALDDDLFRPPGLCFAEGDGDGEGGSGGDGGGADAGADGAGDGGTAGDSGGGDAGGGGAGAAAASAASAQTDWHESLPEELKTAAKNFHTPADAVRNNVDLRKKLSKAIVPVDKTSSPEEIATYRKAVGVPDAPDGYDIAIPDDLPDTVKPNDEMTAKFRAAMHEAGVPQSYVQAATDFHFTALKEQHAVLEAEDAKRRQEAEAATRKMWGPDYDKNHELMTRGLNSYPAEFAKYIDDTGLGNDPTMAQVLYDIGRYKAEDPMVGGVSADEAKTIEERRAEIRSDDDYWTQSSPRYVKLHEEMQSLGERLPGGQTPVVGRGGRTV